MVFWLHLLRLKLRASNSGKLLEELDSASSPGGLTWPLSFSAWAWTFTRTDHGTKRKLSVANCHQKNWLLHHPLCPLVEKLALFKWAELVKGAFQVAVLSFQAFEFCFITCNMLKASLSLISWSLPHFQPLSFALGGLWRFSCKQQVLCTQYLRNALSSTLNTPEAFLVCTQTG